MAAPRPIEERRLVDDVRPVRHRRFRRGRGRPQLIAAVRDRAVEGNLDDPLALRTKLAEVSLLMLRAAATDDVELRIGTIRARREAGHRRALESRQVLAGEVADEVRGCEDGAAVEDLHAAPRYPRAVSARLTRLPSARSAQTGRNDRHMSRAHSQSAASWIVIRIAAPLPRTAA